MTSKDIDESSIWNKAQSSKGHRKIASIKQEKIQVLIVETSSLKNSPADSRLLTKIHRSDDEVLKVGSRSEDDGHTTQKTWNESEVFLDDNFRGCSQRCQKMFSHLSIRDSFLAQLVVT